MKINIICYLLLFIFTACSLQFGEPSSDSEKNKTNNISNQAGECLLDIYRYSMDFFKLKVSAGKLFDVWDCKEKYKITDAFANKIKGENPNFYTKKEVGSFIETFFLKKEKLSTGFLNQIMKFKQLILGGSSDKITKKELDRFSLFLDKIEKILLTIAPYIEIYVNKNLNNKTVSNPNKYFNQAYLALMKVIPQINDIFQASSINYNLDDFVVFLKLLKKDFYEDSEWKLIFYLEENLPYFYILKNNLIDDDSMNNIQTKPNATKSTSTSTSTSTSNPNFKTNIVLKNEWLPILNLVLKGFSEKLRYNFFLKDQNIFLQENWPHFYNFIKNICDLLIYLLQTKNTILLSKESLNDFFISLASLNGKKKVPSKDTIKIFIDNFLHFKSFLLATSDTNLSVRDFQSIPKFFSNLSHIQAKIGNYLEVYYQWNVPQINFPISKTERKSFLQFEKKFDLASENLIASANIFYEAISNNYNYLDRLTTEKSEFIIEKNKYILELTKLKSLLETSKVLFANDEFKRFISILLNNFEDFKKIKKFLVMDFKEKEINSLHISDLENILINGVKCYLLFLRNDYFHKEVSADGLIWESFMKTMHGAKTVFASILHYNGKVKEGFEVKQLHEIVTYLRKRLNNPIKETQKQKRFTLDISEELVSEAIFLKGQILNSSRDFLLLKDFEGVLELVEKFKELYIKMRPFLKFYGQKFARINLDEINEFLKIRNYKTYNDIHIFVKEARKNLIEVADEVGKLISKDTVVNIDNFYAHFYYIEKFIFYDYLKKEKRTTRDGKIEPVAAYWLTHPSNIKLCKWANTNLAQSAHPDKVRGGEWQSTLKIAAYGYFLYDNFLYLKYLNAEIKKQNNSTKNGSFNPTKEFELKFLYINEIKFFIDRVLGFLKDNSFRQANQKNKKRDYNSLSSNSNDSESTLTFLEIDKLIDILYEVMEKFYYLNTKTFIDSDVLKKLLKVLISKMLRNLPSKEQLKDEDFYVNSISIDRIEKHHLNNLATEIDLWIISEQFLNFLFYNKSNKLSEKAFIPFNELNETIWDSQVEDFFNSDIFAKLQIVDLNKDFYHKVDSSINELKRILFQQSYHKDQFKEYSKLELEAKQQGLSSDFSLDYEVNKKSTYLVSDREGILNINYNDYLLNYNYYQSHLNDVNFQRALFRLVLRGYSQDNFRAKNFLGISEEESQWIHNDTIDLGKQMKKIHPDSMDVNKSIFYLADLFSFYANGNLYFDLYEGVGAFSMIASGAKRAHLIYDIMVNKDSTYDNELKEWDTYLLEENSKENCVAFNEKGQIAFDPVGDPYLDRECFKEKVYNNFWEKYYYAFESMPSMLYRIKDYFNWQVSLDDMLNIRSLKTYDNENFFAKFDGFGGKLNRIESVKKAHNNFNLDKEDFNIDGEGTHQYFRLKDIVEKEEQEFKQKFKNFFYDKIFYMFDLASRYPNRPKQYIEYSDVNIIFQLLQLVELSMVHYDKDQNNLITNNEVVDDPFFVFKKFTLKFAEGKIAENDARDAFMYILEYKKRPKFKDLPAWMMWKHFDEWKNIPVDYDRLLFLETICFLKSQLVN